MVDVAERNEKKRLSVARRRNALRSDGYRPVQLWVPDLRNLEVRSACLRDLEAIRDDPREREYHSMLEAAAADITEWEY
ncbi:MAG: antitoxin MazE-like protein [Pyramidobacter porci]|uniref:antitoxin MazE-like protein n=1 Tax=Pyramidobacter porci TaxID=2605789 RepID=UPI002A7566C6|nr:antitoxin MazE-like protein [Pyramidobacter porci]MDY2647844.1 antitoxin MazE-like protein [Pyramidobacter porci]